MGWIKLHVAVDHKSKQVLSFHVTDERVHDSEMLIPLLRQLADHVGPNKVEKALGDTGYDSKPNFNYMEKRGITPTIKPRKNALSTARQPLSRKRLVRTIKRHGYTHWAEKAKYGLRWAVEGFFSTFKRTYGEILKATSPLGMLKELIMKIHFYNRLITYKGPSTSR